MARVSAVTSTSSAPKYTRPECERRWLVREIPSLPSTCDAIHDRYLDDCRLRLRRLERGGDVVYKLSKKFASDDARVHPLVTIYLDEAEYRALAVLPAATLDKRRYHVDGGFSVDVFDGHAHGLAMVEIEADSLAALDAVAPPSFAGVEVTRDPFFSGGSICRASAEEIRSRS